MNERERGVLVGALGRPRYEVVPVGGAEDLVLAHLSKDVKVTATVSPRRGIDHTLDFCERLRKEGFTVVPHLSARLLRDLTHLAAILDRLREAGIHELFVVGGDIDEPIGDFPGADALLVAMSKMGHHLHEIGIAGYPESHPLIDDDVTIQAMWDKRRHATHIVSQICFRPKTIGEWVRRIRRRGVDLPVYVGIPGVVDARKLLRIAAKTGVGESARFLSRHRSWFLRLAFPGGYSPDRLIRGLLPYMVEPRNAIAGFHVYTFNELIATERWRRHTLERLTS